MFDDEETSFERLEEAACAGYPKEYVAVLGVRIDGDKARVWMLTNDVPPFEPYESNCVRVADGWRETDGSGGFSVDTPEDVLAEAGRLGWK